MGIPICNNGRVQIQRRKRPLQKPRMKGLVISLNLLTVYSVYPLKDMCDIPFQGSVNFKIGVLYAKEGQSSDDEFFSNGMY